MAYTCMHCRVCNVVAALTGLHTRTATDPKIKWLELRKQGKIKERETYEQYGESRGETNVRRLSHSSRWSLIVSPHMA